MHRRKAWLLTGAFLGALAVGGGALAVIPALAEEPGTTVVPKTSPATSTSPATGALPAQGALGQQPGAQREPVQTPPEAAAQPKDQLRPAQDVGEGTAPASAGAPAAPQPYDAAAPVPGDEAQPTEINSGADQGAGWDAAVDAAPGPTPLIGDDQTKAVERVNAYFNGINSLQGKFDQVDSQGKHASGRFYVQRPGKLRFDYAPPSPLRIVADGHYLAIEDSDLKTIEKYPLESTPFRLLLGDAVDLARDARILGVERDEGTLAITLSDKTGDAAGQMKLFFDTSSGNLQLKQWIVTDAQGLATKVALDSVEPGRKVAADFFESKANFNPFH
jgi:outer membrane lipoprotein-sorting protein